MIRFMIHTPVNTRGYLMDYVRNNLQELEKEIGDKITIYTPHDAEYSTDCSELWLGPCIEKGILPDVILTHATEFAALKGRNEGDLFSTMAGQYAKENPVREELAILDDPEGLFYPLFVVPLVMCYNTRIVKQDDLKHAWTDLFNEKYKVILPDRDKPLSRAVGAFLQKQYPDEFLKFEIKAVYEGSPNIVVKSVISGEYHMAISNASFAMMAKNKGVEVNQASEGVVLLPQVLVWKKGASEKLKIFADLLMRKEIQDYLGEQGNWPALKGAQMGDTIHNNGQLKTWSGWDAYIKEVAEFDIEVKGGRKTC